MLLRTILLTLMLLVACATSGEFSYGVCIASCYGVAFVGKLFRSSAPKSALGFANFIGPTLGGGAVGLHGTEDCVKACQPFADKGSGMSHKRFGHTTSLLTNGKVLVTGGTDEGLNCMMSAEFMIHQQEIGQLLVA